MILLDNHRYHVEVNGAYLRLLDHPRNALIGQPGSEFVSGAPLSEAEWRAAFRWDKFTGVRELTCDDGRRVKVEFAGHPELVTGRYLVLVVALRTVRAIHRLSPGDSEPRRAVRLSSREREVVRLVPLGLSSPGIADE